MSETRTIEIFDVMEDGFPAEDGGSVAFFWDGQLFTGWPLIDTDNSYPGDRNFATPEQAANGPMNIRWEASEDRVSGMFAGVRHWFYMPDPRQDT